jgi:ribose transport system ATP-binding protein
MQMKPDQVLVKTIDISKSFSGVTVLNKINIDIFQGEILGIIGENGAGKSTFVKILNGTYTPTEGQTLFAGNPVHIRDTSVAKRLGVSTIPQEFNLINDLNVYENIFLGKELIRGRYLLDKREMQARTRQLLQELNTDIDPDAKIQNLSVAQKQMVEIAKAIAADARLLIMDEPTTVLTKHEIDILFHLMQRLKARGVTIIYISHKLREVKQICDRVMVLRDGEFISLDPTESIDEQEMARRMVGRDLNQIFPPKTSPQATSVLEVKQLSVTGVLHDISFDLRQGEILGFSGLTGAGRTELAEALIGIRPVRSGSIIIKGQEQAISSPMEAVRQGIAYLSEDRQGTGVLTNFHVAGNITLVSLEKYCRPLIDYKEETARTESYIKTFNIRTPSVKTPLEYLSGGNQQKVSLAKSLDPRPEIFIIDEPTRGIDVNAKKEIYHFIHDLVRSGISCILISSEMEEILGLCNRVVVMREGRVTGILEEDQMNEAEIMFYATGLKEGA